MEPHSNMSFLAQYQQPDSQERIFSVPLEWQHLPADIVSKQFTKLNQIPPFRIHYLGPRPQHTLAVHKKYGQQVPGELKIKEHPTATLQNYRVNLQKIVACNLAGVQNQENHYRTTLFYRAFEGMNPTLNLNQEFVFNGAFESGNLDCVIKVHPNQFDIFLRIDSNTRGHINWYFFSVKNGSRLEKVTLNICNIKKPSLLYHQGMRPYIFSRKMHQKLGKSWQQGGQNCHFQEAIFRYSIIYEMMSPKKFYRLSFDYEFTDEDDEVFFAYCIPYTYSQLQQDIQKYSESAYVQPLSLGRSLSGLDLPLLHISNHQEDKNKVQKKSIVIAGRVHPGQSNGSLIVKGLIQYLTNDSKQAIELRNNLNIFIIPMLNPDGVILGNTRTSAAGKDLNRQFINPQSHLYPEIYHLKNFVMKLQRYGQTLLYLDIHGHSRKKSTFAYGPNYLMQNSDYFPSRFLPKLIEKANPIFRYYSCSFNISEEKKTTARAVMISQMKIPYVYTIESSIGLYFNPIQLKILPFTSLEWQQTGESIVKAIANLISIFNDANLLSKERKNQRDKRKERAWTSSGSRFGRKYAEEESQSSKNKDRISFYQQLMKQIKNTNMKAFQKQADSDDHDSDEDLPNLQLKQLKKHMMRFQQSNPVKRLSCLEQVQVHPCIPASSNVSLLQSEIKTEALKKIGHRSSRTTDKIYQEIPSAKITKTIDFQAKGSFESTKKTRFSVSQTRKIPQSASKYQIKNISLNKPRYSLATKNLFPVEDKSELLTIPKSLQIIRKEIKKGRILISNLEQNRLKYLSKQKQEKKEHSESRKGPFVHADLSKMRSAVRSSTSNFECTVSNSFNSPSPEPIRKQSQVELFSNCPNALQGIQIDNFAMKITTFKRR